MSGRILEITAEEYHRDELPGIDPMIAGLSSSIADVLVSKSAAHAYAAHPKLGAEPSKTSDSFDLGTAVHSILLEGFDRIVEVDAKDWKTKAAQEERDAARAAGHVPMLLSQAERCRKMVAAVRETLERDWSDADPPVLATNGTPEVPVVAEIDGVICRALIDWLHPDYRTIDDVKTTGKSGAPGTWERQIFSMGYGFRAAFHSRVVQELAGEMPRFRWIVLETYPPFAVSVFESGPAALQLHREQVEFAIRKWGECLTTGRFPGYPSRVATAELPSWELERWLDREERDELEGEETNG